jgi:dephospho-CoA kinase
MSTVLRIALTGGIGSGKSTVANKFQALGAPIIDSDVISREIVKPGAACLDHIIDEFGSDLLTSKGILDRDKLRNIIFNDAAAKKKLEDILHPVIYQEIEDQVSRVNYPYCLIVIPLLVETQTMDRFDRVLLVDAKKDLQIKRTASRDKMPVQIIEKIINSQVNRSQHLKYADDIIDNNVNIEELNEAVFKMHEKYLKPGNL